MVKFLIFQRRRILQNVSQNEVRFHTPQHGEISHFSTQKDFTKRLSEWSKEFHTPHMVKFLIFQRRRILQSVCQNEVRCSTLLTWWNFSFLNAEGFYKASVRMKYGVPHFEADMWSMIHTQTRNFPFVWKYIYFFLNVFLLSEIINLFFIHVF